jgi:TM2 domain-containing membrane protein YozV
MSALWNQSSDITEFYEEGFNVKSKTTALILAILLPGIDRLYLGKVWTGILKIITGGGLGIWWIIDIISIASDKAIDKKGNKLQ